MNRSLLISRAQGLESVIKNFKFVSEQMNGDYRGNPKALQLKEVCDLLLSFEVILKRLLESVAIITQNYINNISDKISSKVDATSHLRCSEREPEE